MRGGTPYNDNNIKVAQTTQNIRNFIVRELSLQEMTNFGD